MEFKDGSITSPAGILAAGVSCGIKKNQQKDLALVQINGLGTAAAVFTRNQVKGHSLLRSQRLADQGQSIHAIVINSGNANACVGPEGDMAAEQMASLTADALGIAPESVLTCSTGVIGQPLPMDRLNQGISDAAARLQHEPDSGHAAAEAIMTTDKTMKEAVVSFTLDGTEICVAGMAKGSGMIHPNMATMIAVITTDAVIEQSFLQDTLRLVTEKTFNRVSVDGDTSVCDTAIVVTSGLAANKEINATTDEAARLFTRALETVCHRLARSIASDGEGATKLIDVRVEGAYSPEAAYRVALAVARSPLFKTAMYGEDANWGRVITAIGNSEVAIDPHKVNIAFGPLAVCRDGRGLPFDEAEALAILKNDEIIVTIDLGMGPYSDHYWTCDFSHEYVEINGSYRS